MPPGAASPASTQFGRQSRTAESEREVLKLFPPSRSRAKESSERGGIRPRRQSCSGLIHWRRMHPIVKASMRLLPPCAYQHSTAEPAPNAASPSLAAFEFRTEWRRASCASSARTFSWKRKEDQAPGRLEGRGERATGTAKSVSIVRRFGAGTTWPLSSSAQHPNHGVCQSRLEPRTTMHSGSKPSPLRHLDPRYSPHELRLLLRLFAASVLGSFTRWTVSGIRLIGSHLDTA